MHQLNRANCCEQRQAERGEKLFTAHQHRPNGTTQDGTAIHGAHCTSQHNMTLHNITHTTTLIVYLRETKSTDILLTITI